MNRPGLTAPVIGATQPGQLDTAVAAMALRLEDEENRVLEAEYSWRKPKDATHGAASQAAGPRGPDR